MNDHRPYVWVLNPDAERELGATHSYAVRAAFMQRMAERRPLFERLVQGEPTVFSHELKPSAAPLRALFWCPTPRVLEAAVTCGLSFSAQPGVAVLRQVHDKRYITGVLSDFTLPGRVNIASDLEWRHLRASTRGPLRLKRPFGYAGKGQRIWPEIGGEDHTWMADSLRSGGFAAEPHIENAPEYSMHGFVDARGTLLGSACVLTTDRHSAPVSIQRAAPRDDSFYDAIGEVAHAAARVLSSAGYFGPFGIDVLVLHGRPHLIDLNPRFTLGWSIGMGDLRAEAITRALEPKTP